MSKTFGGYGRYEDDPSCIGCPRANSDMTPCVARDGSTATTEVIGGGDECVGCGLSPSDLLKELVTEVTDSHKLDDFFWKHLHEHYPEAQLDG